ncbi:hypothetical protein SARC_11850 [Sphaeroforma arctica JP610]|uniref:PUL domain-containing protein n=1 Tax=Sphaeroforma arctica JP610 TaxID=667725 RepID=A0A0L0FFS8_9EUKA|nr:hypothetical protein SARC_11850 [Sphaeroforma arctica JP610]KNC75627.1 hypothetical protein SARC_11850 [Sphaeroforma arctica JP610]|eukprot:XP_014149529.1 hypothetical protein SARC_11850 [Sphaeroforma arctica JP610]
MTRKDIEPTTELVIQCLTLLGDIVLTEKDPEVLFRALVALGTYTSLSTSIRSIVSQLEFGKAVELISRSGGAEFSNVRKCADAVLKML